MRKFFDKRQLFLIIYYCVVFLSVVFLVTHQLDKPSDYSSYASDIGSHIFFVEPFFEGKVYIPHPLWHIFVHYMNTITMNATFSAALVTAFLVLLWLYIAKAIYMFLTETSENNLKLYAFLLIVFIIGPAYVPLISNYIIAGTGSPNIWHNVTLIAVKPFALLTLFFTILGLQAQEKKYYILGILFLSISIFAKPSFVIAFLPALALFMLFKKMFSKSQLLFFATMSVIAVSILGYQFLHTFGEGDGKSTIIISFLGVWSRASSNVPLSILLAVLFPLLYSTLHFKHTKQNNYLVLTWIITFISIAYAAFLAESGPRFNHGNFFWSYMISLSLLYVFSLIDYFKHMDHMKFYTKIVLNIVLLWQIIVGLFYFVSLMMGAAPSGLVDFQQWIH